MKTEKTKLNKTVKFYVRRRLPFDGVHAVVKYFNQLKLDNFDFLHLSSVAKLKQPQLRLGKLIQLFIYIFKIIFQKSETIKIQ